MKMPQRYLIRMLVFIVLVLVMAIFLKHQLATAFMANIFLNGSIVAMLVAGVFYALRRVVDLTPEIEWIKNFKENDSDITSANLGAQAPRLMAAAAPMLMGQGGERMRLSALSTRSVLDGIASRLEESREISRYFTGLLIFLGLLGTFWGLLGTIGAIGQTINSLTVDGSDIALMFDELKKGLQAPLSGMGTAFSSSLFGLAGSLVLGFMDLQASQAQTRFYNDVEDWLSSVTNLSRGEDVGGGGGAAMASPSAYTTALMEQTADGIERLSRTLKRSDEDSRSLNDAMQGVAEAISSLSDKMASQDNAGHQAGHQVDESSKAIVAAIEKLAVQDKVPAPAIDDASRKHLSNIDVGLKRLIEEQSRSSDAMVEELRSELKLISRTIAAGMDASKSAASTSAKGKTSATPDFIKSGKADT